MSQEKPSEFVINYAAILKEAWTGGEEFKQRLMAEPAQVVKEFGLDPGDAKISIITEIRGEGTVDDQVRLWQEGKAAGSIDFYVPLEEPVDLDDVELSDEMLEMVAGGGCTCCSCPCSCCCC